MNLPNPAPQKKSSPLLQVSTLGSFSVQIGTGVISDSSARTQRMWKLFKYLITFPCRPIPVDTLISVLWEEEEDCVNPTKALYSLVYRLRGLLAPAIADDKAFLLFQHGSYVCNPDNSCAVDALQFENLALLAKNAERVPEKIELFLRAISPYNGTYLPESAAEEWVIPVAAYYQRIYAECIDSICQLYYQTDDYDPILRVCQQAAGIDPLEETFHYHLLKGMINTGRISAASAHYEYVSKLLYKEFGIEPSAKLQTLKKILHQAGLGTTGNIGEIKKLLREPGTPQGAFYCDFETFRQIYQLEMRAMIRSGQSVFLALITLELSQYNDLLAQTLSEGMRLLRTACIKHLRRGDVVSQYSNSQFTALLPAMMFEDQEAIIKRIEEAFFKDPAASKFKVRFEVSPLEGLL